MAPRPPTHPGRELVTKFSSRQSQKDATRQRIAEAAVEVFEEKGFLGATVDEIARKAAIGRTTFYLHFQTKMDLANEIGLSQYPAAEQIFTALGKIDYSNPTAIKAWLRRLKRLVKDNATKTSVSTQANIADPSLGQDLADIWDEWAATIVNEVQGSIGKAAAEDLELVRYLLLGLDRYTYMTQIQNVRMRRSLEDAVVANIAWTLRTVAGHGSV